MSSFGTTCKQNKSAETMHNQNSSFSRNIAHTDERREKKTEKKSTITIKQQKKYEYGYMIPFNEYVLM